MAWCLVKHRDNFTFTSVHFFPQSLPFPSFLLSFLSLVISFLSLPLSLQVSCYKAKLCIAGRLQLFASNTTLLCAVSSWGLDYLARSGCVAEESGSDLDPAEASPTSPTSPMELGHGPACGYSVHDFRLVLPIRSVTHILLWHSVVTCQNNRHGGVPSSWWAFSVHDTHPALKVLLLTSVSLNPFHVTSHETVQCLTTHQTVCYVCMYVCMYVCVHMCGYEWVQYLVGDNIKADFREIVFGIVDVIYLSQGRVHWWDFMIVIMKLRIL
jgi:hypothetical protein